MSERIYTCKNCRFYEAGILNDGEHEGQPRNWGLCRINPPVALMEPQGVDGYWPNTREVDWCGAHQSIPWHPSSEVQP